MRPIAVFYHCLFYLGNPPELSVPACNIVSEQMDIMRESGLTDAATWIFTGINGGKESDEMANLLLPSRSIRLLHGLDSRSENKTIIAIEKWVKYNPDVDVLYFHAKGASQSTEDPMRARWRNCMMRNLVKNWRRCVMDLSGKYDSVGCHWLTNMGSDRSQNYWGGNFWWAKSSFLKTLPSLMNRDRIKMSGISSLESRYEAEVWIGTGSKLPVVNDYHQANPSIVGVCI